MNFSTETVGGFRQVDSQSESTYGNKKKRNKPFIYLKYQNIVLCRFFLIFYQFSLTSNSALFILPFLCLFSHFSSVLDHCTTSPPLSYEDEEFVKLTGGKDTLSFIKFLGMADVEDMISCEALTMEDVTEIWYVRVIDMYTIWYFLVHYSTR